MKKIILVATLFVAGLLNAQESQEEKLKPTISVFAALSDNIQIGISIEEFSFLDPTNKNKSIIINGIYQENALNYTLVKDIKGKGGQVDLGFRTYFNKNNNNKGFFFSNYMTYSYMDYDKGIYQGKYKYFSFLNPEIGYKIKIKKLALEPFISNAWKIEVKGKGFVDNKDFGNYDFRAGFKIGYSLE